MKITIKHLPKSEIELTCQVSPKELEPFLNEASSTISRDLEIKGFRPGKAPRKMVEQIVGEERVWKEGTRLALAKLCLKVFLEKKIEAISKPKIEIIKIAPHNPLIFKAKTAVLPKIKLADYKRHRVSGKKWRVKVKEKEIDKALEYLQKSRRKYITVNRPAQRGDRVEIDFQSRLGGVKIEDGESKNHPLVIGQGFFVPGFEEKLEGMEEGAEKNFSLAFPSGHFRKDLAGKTVDFKVKMNLVQKTETPEINDEFARSLGNFKDLKNLKESIKQGLLEEKEEEERDRRRVEIIEGIAQKSQMEIPDILVDQELEKMLKELEYSIKQLGLNFSIYLNKIKKSPEDLKRQWRTQAEKRVRIALVLREIALKEDIKVEDQEVEDRVNGILKKYPTPEQAEKEVDLDSLKEYVRGMVRNEKVFELLEG